MGIGDIFRALIGAGQNYYEKQSGDFNSGYNRGQEQASKMSDDELRSELRRKKENGISGGMSGAGNTRAMIDEYNNRKNKR